MSYSFSISGHVDTEAAEWALIQSLAGAVQAAGASSTTGSTQFHGLVNLLAVQAGGADEPAAAGTELASAVQPVPTVNEAGEVVGFGPPAAPDGSPAPGLAVAPPEAPAPSNGPQEVTTDTPGVQTNAAGEVVGTIDPDTVDVTAIAAPPVGPGPAEPGSPHQGPTQEDVVPLISSLKPLYNGKGDIIGYVEA